MNIYNSDYKVLKLEFKSKVKELQELMDQTAPLREKNNYLVSIIKKVGLYYILFMIVLNYNLVIFSKFKS